ncbi:hypothetical protein K438DRAFT_1806179 [Mycena galopus ATCC 62051]|nr:hypothetical protein K438DRAFT_1806179 [Mycena galopus ATCC 62051]
MREEKARGELERYAKDVEMMRWENGAWRRREAELQAQVHHLMHQLQTYAALFHAQAHNHPQMQNGSPAPGSPSSPPNGQYGGPVPNGYPTGGYPIPGMFSPPMLSPGQLQPLQPYFAYPMPPPPPSIPPPHQHQPQQPTLFSMLFPGAVNMKGEGRGSASGSAKGSARGDGGGSAKGSESVSGSSVGSGSGSPDLVGSPSPAPGPSSVDRGRRRTRTQTAEARFGMGIVGASWEGEVGEGWVGVEHETGERPEYDGLEQYDHEHDHDREGEGDYDGDGYENEEGYGYEDDGGFSDVLADAILKRPESMRVRSRPKQRDRERPAQGGGGYKQRRDGSVGEMPVLPLALENLADPTPILHKGSSSQLDEESQS